MATYTVSEENELQVLVEYDEALGRNAKVPVIAPLKVADGWNVTLSGEQAEWLESITDGVNELIRDGINLDPDQFQVLDTKINQLNEILSRVESIRSNTNRLSSLVNITTQLTEIIEVLSEQNQTDTSSNNQLSSLIDETELHTTKINTILSNLDNINQYLSSLDLTLEAIDLKLNKKISSVSQKLLILAIANQEYSFTIPVNTKRFSIRCRKGATDPVGLVRYAFTSDVVNLAGASGDDTYSTIDDIIEYSETDIQLLNPLTVYFASSVPNLPLVVNLWLEQA